MNDRLADIRNFPQLKDIVRNDAAFFWKNNAEDYARDLITAAPVNLYVEVRKI